VKMATPGAVPDAALDGAGTPDAFVRARRQTWGLIGVVIGLSALLRFYFGPLRQDPGYHFFADTRLLGAIPRAGDVLTNIAILAAGLAGLGLWRRVHIAPEERPVYGLLVTAMLATAAGSAWYHWAPSDARLVWDRLPMTLVVAALATLVLADRVHPAFARAAWWPFPSPRSCATARGTGVRGWPTRSRGRSTCRRTRTPGFHRRRGPRREGRPCSPPR